MKANTPYVKSVPGHAMLIDCPICATRTRVWATRSNRSSLRAFCKGCENELDISLDVPFVVFRDADNAERREMTINALRRIDAGEKYTRRAVDLLMNDRRFTIRVE